MCHDFFPFFSEPSDPAANRCTHHKSCCVQTDLGSEQNHWCHDLCWSLRFLILPGIWRKIKKKHTTISMLLQFSLKCVFSTGWFWWSSGVWEFRGLDSGGLCVLGNKHLRPPFPCSLCPHLPAALLDWQDYRFQLDPQSEYSFSVFDSLLVLFLLMGLDQSMTSCGSLWLHMVFLFQL